jgi:broad specificity phosphatase PhoE
MLMRHLVFIRHGESELNAVNRHTRTYCGQFETPLTDFGRQQARAAGEKVAERAYLSPRAAVSSPLKRAEETLSLVLSRLPADVQLLPPSPGLLERSHGQFEGLAESDVFRDYPHYREHPDYCHFMNHFGQCAPGGETLASVTDRAWSAVLELTRATTGDIIIVSHFNPIRCILGRALDFTPEETLRLHIPNAEPVVLGFNGSFSLVEAPDLYVWER